MWSKNIDGTFLGTSLNEQNSALPESRVKEITGKRFISFYFEKGIDEAGNTSLEFQETVPQGIARGVVRFDNALEKDLQEKSRVNMRELSRKGVDGAILTQNGIPAGALTTKENNRYNEMLEAAADLEKKYLCVDYADKEEVKSIGALWDSKAKSWYIPEDFNTTGFSAWQPELLDTSDGQNDKFFAKPHKGEAEKLFIIQTKN